jgi:serine/threonine protein phosphatase PrpC
LEEKGLQLSLFLVLGRNNSYYKSLNKFFPVRFPIKFPKFFKELIFNIIKMLKYKVRAKKKHHDSASRDSFTVDEKQNLFMLVHGFGRRPDESSSLVLNRLEKKLEDGLLVISDPKSFDDYSPEDIKECVQDPLRQALKEVHNNLLAISTHPYPESKEAPLAATADICVIDDVHDKAYIAHVGHGRVYLFRGGQLKQITEDHWEYIHDSWEGRPRLLAKTRITSSLGADARDAEDIDYEEALEGLKIGQYVVDLQPGDVILIGQSAITDRLTNQEITDILVKFDQPEYDAAQSLVEKAQKPEEMAEAYAKAMEVSVDDALIEIGGKDAAAIAIKVYEKAA